MMTREEENRLANGEYLADSFNRLEHKLNEAVEDIRLLGRMGANICPVCAHYNHGAGDPEKCPNALKEDCFEWRGTKEG